MFAGKIIKERDRLAKERDLFFRKTPENWDFDVLATDVEARKSLRHAFDIVLELRAGHPKLVDDLLRAISDEHQKILLRDD